MTLIRPRLLYTRAYTCWSGVWCPQKDKQACRYRRAAGTVQPTCTAALCGKIKSQGAVTSAKCLLCAGDTPFKTLMKFFPLVWFSICLACTTAQRFEFFSSISPQTSDLFFFLSFFLVVMFSVLKQAGAPRQAIHHVWMCSDTSSSQGLISQGKMGVWRVYILFPFLCCIKNPPSPLSFPPRCRRDVRRGKTDADPSLTPEEEGKRLASRQTWIAFGDNRNPNPPTGVYRPRHVCLRVCISACVCVFAWVISIHRPPFTMRACFSPARKTDAFGVWTCHRRLREVNACKLWKVHLRGPLRLFLRDGFGGNGLQLCHAPDKWNGCRSKTRCINSSLISGCDVSRGGEMEGEALTRKTDWNMLVSSRLALLTQSVSVWQGATF